MVTQAEGALSKHGWQLVEMGRSDTLRSIPPEFIITVGFEEERVHGASACNRYFASYRLSDEFQIQFQAIGSARMMCSEAAMVLESEYFAALEQIEAYQLRADQLTLFYEQGKSKMLFVYYEEQEK